eukprot:m.338199 g.338199  ORF g.338199 m.338199 type:complete len:457 (-) comp18341_c0_seq1:80-1450(-)
MVKRGAVMDAPAPTTSFVISKKVGIPYRICSEYVKHGASELTPCPVEGCNKKYKSTSGLQYHLENHHKGAVLPTPGEFGSRISGQDENDDEQENRTILSSKLQDIQENLEAGAVTPSRHVVHSGKHWDSSSPTSSDAARSPTTSLYTKCPMGCPKQYKSVSGMQYHLEHHHPGVKYDPKEKSFTLPKPKTKGKEPSRSTPHSTLQHTDGFISWDSINVEDIGRFEKGIPMAESIMQNENIGSRRKRDHDDSLNRHGSDEADISSPSRNLSQAGLPIFYPKDLLLFGLCPMVDPLHLVACCTCGQRVLATALLSHAENCIPPSKRAKINCKAASTNSSLNGKHSSSANIKTASIVTGAVISEKSSSRQPIVCRSMSKEWHRNENVTNQDPLINWHRKPPRLKQKTEPVLPHKLSNHHRLAPSRAQPSTLTTQEYKVFHDGDQVIGRRRLLQPADAKV